MNQSTLKIAIDMERNREWYWRNSTQGKFESSMVHYDGWAENANGADKLEPFSDDGDGVERLVASVDDDERERERRITAALSRLSASDRRFAEEILRGKSWRDLGYENNSGFYKRLDRLIQKVRKNGNFGKLC